MADRDVQYPNRRVDRDREFIGAGNAQLVVYPDGLRGISRPRFNFDRCQRYLVWYDTHVRGE